MCSSPIQLLDFPFFAFFNTFLFWALLLYFLNIVWPDAKKNGLGDRFVFPCFVSLLALNVLTGCRTSVLQILHKNQPVSCCLSRGCFYLERSLYYWCSAVPAGHSSVRNVNIQDKCVHYLYTVWRPARVGRHNSVCVCVWEMVQLFCAERIEAPLSWFIPVLHRIFKPPRRIFWYVEWFNERYLQHLYKEITSWNSPPLPE